MTIDLPNLGQGYKTHLDCYRWQVTCAGCGLTVTVTQHEDEQGQVVLPNWRNLPRLRFEMGESWVCSAACARTVTEEDITNLWRSDATATGGTP